MKRALLFASALVLGCAQTGDVENTDTGEEFLEDAEVVPEGKADDFLSARAREFILSGTDEVTLEPEYESRTEAQRLERARQLVSRRQTALAWFLNQYVVDKEPEDSNASYGGFGAMAKAADYESTNIRRVSGLRYAFDFEQLLAGRTDLMSKLGTKDGPRAGTRQFTLWVGVPTNAEMESDPEWYRKSPWDSWYPGRVGDSQKRAITVTMRRESVEDDAWFDYQRLFADGVLDIDVHFGWDYHDNYHLRHSRSLASWLVSKGFTAPVRSFDQLTRTSGAYTRTLNADGRQVRVEVRIFYGKPDTDTDPSTDAGGMQLEADLRDSLARRDVILYSGHSGPFYGFAMGNWRVTSEGDLDDSELATVVMPRDRYQIVLANGCETLEVGAGFAANPNKPNRANLDVITTTSFSNAGTPDTVTSFITRLIERDSRGRHRPRTVKSLLAALDTSGGSGFYTMYGMHGVDDNPRLHPYADREMFGQACSANADCGGLGNLCVRPASRQPKVCTAACTSAVGCGDGYRCAAIASSSSSTIYGNACVPR
jgi:hypothetical protein